MNTKRLWILLGVVLLGSFSVLGFFGREVYRQAPPIPDRVVTANGSALFDKEEILLGQQVWQSIGGQQVGTIWGHGAYQAPDWSADWLHREATALLEQNAQARFHRPFAELGAEEAAGVREHVKREMRLNGYDASTGVLRVSEARAKAMEEAGEHYLGLFGDQPGWASLRKAYALHENAVPDTIRRVALTRFFFWTAWACTTERPHQAVTYTNNWPHEPLVGNEPTSGNILWSIISVVLLIAAIGGLVFYKAFRAPEEPLPAPPLRDPLDGLVLTPSMRAIGKYVAVVLALFVVQALFGALTAHYTVEGDAFFGFPLSRYLPYAVTRTWHVQLGIFWIATAFLAAGLFLAPAVGGAEPRYQRLGVNILFGALVAVVAGSLAGEWLSTRQGLGLAASFWIGRQGYEYVDLGRLWQIALFIGLILWLGLTLRALWPALTRPRGATASSLPAQHAETRPIVLLFAGSAAAIGLFYGAGFFYGAKTHLSVMEYWRWWVVHLWVEGFMEVFATAALSFIFVRLGLVRPQSATRTVLLSTSIFLVSGVPGTFHHLYFSGTPVSIMAVGAAFSALEVVPLALVGYEAWETAHLGSRAPWMQAYRWPIRFFLGVAFWNLVGAGVFGFLINPPISLYYLQGLNTTPVHGHAALFGVYGLLALGLCLLVARRLTAGAVWRDRPLAAAFWLMNVGLALMIALSLLPIGLIQARASIEVGLWYARSAELMQQPLMQALRWLRMAGDGLFLAGVGALVWFFAGLKWGWSVRSEAPEVPRAETETVPVPAPQAA